MDTSDKNNKINAVATIDVNVKWPSVDKKTWLAESIEEHLNCLFCGSQLAFQRKTDFVEQVVTEHAHCPKCGIKNRDSHHRLQ